MATSTIHTLVDLTRKFCDASAAHDYNKSNQFLNKIIPLCSDLSDAEVSEYEAYLTASYFETEAQQQVKMHVDKQKLAKAVVGEILGYCDEANNNGGPSLH